MEDRDRAAEVGAAAPPDPQVSDVGQVVCIPDDPSVGVPGIDVAAAGLLISPDVPEQVRPQIVDAEWDFEAGSSRSTAWAAGLPGVSPKFALSMLVVGVLFGLITEAVRRAGADAQGNGVVPAWLPVVVAVVVPLLAVLGVGGLALYEAFDDRRANNLVQRWHGHVITKTQQRSAASAFAGVAQRLNDLDTLFERLHRDHHSLLRDGWLPGLTPQTLDGLRYTLTRDLLDTAELRATVALAATRPALAQQTATARARLQAADTAFDEQLAQLRELCSTADTLAAGLRDLALAEQLANGEVTAQQLRHQLPVAGPDLPALVAAAQGTADLLRAALPAADGVPAVPNEPTTTPADDIDVA
jgi:hypothetical protein